MKTHTQHHHTYVNILQEQSIGLPTFCFSIPGHRNIKHFANMWNSLPAEVVCASQCELLQGTFGQVLGQLLLHVGSGYVHHKENDQQRDGLLADHSPSVNSES